MAEQASKSYNITDCHINQHLWITVVVVVNVSWHKCNVLQCTIIIITVSCSRYINRLTRPTEFGYSFYQLVAREWLVIRMALQSRVTYIHSRTKPTYIRHVIARWIASELNIRWPSNDTKPKLGTNSFVRNASQNALSKICAIITVEY